MFVLIEFASDRFLRDHRIKPPDADSQRHGLAEAALEFFRHEKGDGYISLDLYRDNGTLLRMTIQSFDEEKHSALHYFVGEKTSGWGFKTNRNDLTATLLTLAELDQSLCKEDIDPLFCCNYGME